MEISQTLLEKKNSPLHFSKFCDKKTPSIGSINSPESNSEEAFNEKYELLTEIGEVLSKKSGLIAKTRELMEPYIK